VHDDCALACGTIKGFVIALLNATALIVFVEIDDKTECNLESMPVNVTHLSHGSHRPRPFVRLKYMVFESEGSLSLSIVTESQSLFPSPCN
jgi:hypothetical protein